MSRFAGSNSAIGNDFHLNLGSNQASKPSFVLQNGLSKLGADLFARRTLQRAAQNDAERRGENDSSVQKDDHEEAPHAANPPRETPFMDTFYNNVYTGKMAGVGSGVCSGGRIDSLFWPHPAASGTQKQANPLLTLDMNGLIRALGVVVFQVGD